MTAHETAIAFGPVGLAGWALLVLGVMTAAPASSRCSGWPAVVADVTVAELGGFKAMNEQLSSATDPSASPTLESRPL